MNHKISELQTRYSLSSRQSIYDRMKAAGVAQVSRGEISSESLDKLDKLHEFLKKNPGAATWEFPKNTEVMSSGQLDKSTGQLDNFSETLQIIEKIAQYFANKEVPDPIANYKALEYATIHQIFLSTSKIKSLTGAKPRGNQWEWGNFTFTKTEKKAGRERTWWIQLIVRTM